MAGIGFELKKILNRNRLFSIMEVYGYSAVLSSGPWIISIITILFIGLIKTHDSGNVYEIIQFQISITYLLGLSLIFSGFFQISFSRYVADLIYRNEKEKIIPSFLGILFILFVTGFIFILLFSYVFLKNISSLYVIFFIGSFISLLGIWVSNSLLLGIKEYKKILFIYLFSYFLIFILSFTLGNYGFEWLMGSFFIGNSVLFFLLSYVIVHNYQFNKLIDFDFININGKGLILSLGFSGFFYNLGIWADKIIFWFSKDTGYNVIGGLKASVIYDLPLFLSYLSTIPGMAIFFYRLEADFAEKYDYFYTAVRDGLTLKDITDAKIEMIDSIRIMIREIIIIQGIFDMIIYSYSMSIFEVLNIPKLYIPLFHIDLIGVQLQLGLMAMLSVLFYLNKRFYALFISILFTLLNFLLSYITIKHLGVAFFGYGFALSAFVSFIVSLFIIRNVMEDLEYETFMLV
ncbi:MAG: exopolysaccharide Pel transporter PelG [Elusimicrobia bacterium]|nr:exopolysaccharide Pel transporter PelG [Elusimicrobiota bacterium]